MALMMLFAQDGRMSNALSTPLVYVTLFLRACKNFDHGGEE